MADEETIQPDVSEGNQGPQDDQTTAQGQETEQDNAPMLNDPVSRRERRMKEVSELAATQREKDRKSAALMNDPDLTPEEYDAKLESIRTGEEQDPGDEDDDSIAAQGDETKQDDDPKQDDEPKQQSRPGWEERDDGTPVKRLKVNGRVVELTEDEYDRQLAKDLAGDEKLRQAAEKERQFQQELDRRDAALRQQHQPPDGADDEAFEKALSDYHEAVYSGDTEAAKANLREIAKAGRQSSTPNIDELTASISRSVREDIEQSRQQEEVMSGWQKFQDEFADIANHKGRLAYADVHLKAVQEESPHLPPAEMIMEAGRRTADELGLAKDKPAGDSRNEREQRKQTLKTIPRNGSAKNQPPKEPEVDLSPEGKIARMRAARAV